MSNGGSTNQDVEVSDDDPLRPQSSSLRCEYPTDLIIQANYVDTTEKVVQCAFVARWICRIKHSLVEFGHGYDDQPQSILGQLVDTAIHTLNTMKSMNDPIGIQKVSHLIYIFGSGREPVSRSE